MFWLLGKHLELDVKAAMRKSQIQEIVLEHLVDDDVIPKGLIEVPKVSESGSAVEVRKLELQHGLELKKLAEKEEKARLEEKTRREQMEFEERKHERETKMKLEESRLAQEREERETKMKLEESRLAQEREIELAKLNNAKEIAKMQADKGQNISPLSLSGQVQNQSHFNVAQWFQSVPKFRENAVDDFFISFEKMADRLKWPSEYWTTLLQHVLVGRGLEVYNHLGVSDSANYDYVKEAILKAYERVPEAYRQKFRNYTKASSQTFVEFAHAKQRLFDQWCHAMKVDKDFEKLRQLILVEDFKKNVSINLKMYIDEHGPKDLSEAASLADEYALIHQSQFHSKSSSGSKGADKSSSNDQSSVEKQSNASKSSSSKPQSSTPLSSIFCYYCKKRGHVMSECYKLKRKQELQKEQQNLESQQTGTVGHVSSYRSASVQIQSVSEDTVSPVEVSGKPLAGSSSVMESFQPFIHDGFVSLSGDFDNATPIKVLRDTGASQSLMVVDTLSFSDSSYSGTNVLIKGVDSDDFVSVPLHNVHLWSSLVSGPVTVGVRSSLPFEGIQLLLGNDLAGGKVVVNPVVTAKPCVDQSDDPLEKEVPDLYPACAVTRSMSKKAVDTSQSGDIDLMDTFIGQVLGFGLCHNIRYLNLGCPAQI